MIGSVRVLVVAGLVSALTVAVACSDSPTQGRLAPPAPLSDAMYTSYSEFDQLSADATISSEGGYDGFDRPDSFRGQSYALERSLQSNGVWQTTISFSAHNPFGGTVPAEVRYVDVSRIETDDVGSFHRAYDRAGSLITDQPATDNYDPSQGGTPYVPPGAQPMGELAPMPSGGGGGGPPPILNRQSPSPALRNSIPARPDSASRRWLDRMLITPHARIRNLERLRADLGPPQGKIGNLDRYVRSAGEITREVLFDPASGTIVEENLASGGELRLHVRYEYASYAAGVLALSKTRIEQPPSGRSRMRTVVTTTLSNIKISKRSTP